MPLINGVPSLYWPRMAATVNVPTAGTAADRKNQELGDDVYSFQIHPHRARLSYNNHNESDELELTFSYDECGLDPRFVRSAEVYFYAEDAYASGGFEPGIQNLRFVGITRDVERDWNESGGKLVQLHAQDYTCLFLEMKNFPPSGVPDFSMTLAQAWARICDHTGYWDLDSSPARIQSSVASLRDRIEFQGVDPSITLAKGVPERIARLGKPEVSHVQDAWAVWQIVVESLGLISFIRGDRCIVTTATDFYTADDPPRFVYGLNVTNLKETRRLGDVSAKNVCLRSYEPLGGRIIESIYPPAEFAPKKKLLSATGTKRPPRVSHTQDYELFDVPGPLTQEQLEEAAARVWEERTRQELKGTLKTSEMYAFGTLGGYDLLDLQAGDQITVELDRGALDQVQKEEDKSQREQWLINLGYESQTARFIANNLDDISKLPSEFLVHSVVIELEATGGSGGCSFSIEIEYVNRIDITAGGRNPIGAGAASNQATGTHTPYISVTGSKDPSRTSR